MKATKMLMAAAAAALAVTILPISAEAAPKTMPDGTVFDAEYYAAQNPDVVQALGSSEAMLYAHYTNFGKREGRLPYAAAQSTNTTSTSAFDATYYAARYPDVVAALGSDPAMLKRHYDVAGKAEGRYANAAEEQAAIAAAAAAAAAQQAASDASDLSSKMELAHRLVDLVNDSRRGNNKNTVEWTDSLANAAFTRAKEIAEKNSHERPNNTGWTTVLAQDHIKNDGSAECIIVGVATPEEAVHYWERYTDEKNKMRSNDYNKAAAGYDPAQGGCWVLILIRQ